jgi:bifunctional non-homologous end joining protein LigD
MNPMLGRLVRDPFNRPGWIYEIKWDGFRTLAEVSPAAVRLTSRNQNSFNKRFDEIVKALGRLKHEVVLDGEIVALDEDGHSRFEWLLSRNGQRKGRLVYYVFDLLFLDGEDLRALPLHRRKALLKRILKKVPGVLYVDHIEEHGKEFFRLASERGLEGIVAKDKRSPYVGGRTTDYWLKIKNPAFQRKEPVAFRFEKRRT